MKRKLTKAQQETIGRILVKRRRLEAANEHWQFPKVWNMPLNESTFLAMIAFYFPLHISLKKMLQKLCQKELKKHLLLSTSYLYKFKKINPYYYSDRERLIVYCNRYINSCESWHLDACLKDVGTFSDSNLNYLLKGVVELDMFLKNMQRSEHLLQAKLIFHALEEDMGKESKVILAFIYYLEGEFDRSFRVLKKAEADLSKELQVA